MKRHKFAHFQNIVPVHFLYTHIIQYGNRLILSITFNQIMLKSLNYTREVKSEETNKAYVGVRVLDFPTYF